MLLLRRKCIKSSEVQRSANALFYVQSAIIKIQNTGNV